MSFCFCLRSNRKTAWAISTIVSRHQSTAGLRHALTLTSKGQRSNPNHKPWLGFLANVLRYVRYMLPAVRLLSVVCLLSVCLWRWCTLLRRLNFSVIFFHHTIAQGLYFTDAKNRWWGTPLSPWNLRSKWPTPFKTAQFQPISAHSASTVISSEKKFN